MTVLAAVAVAVLAAIPTIPPTAAAAASVLVGRAAPHALQNFIRSLSNDAPHKHTTPLLL